MNEINDKVKKCNEYIFKKNLGISYEEYEQLDFDTQQKLVSEFHKKGLKNSDKVCIMKGSGAHTYFIAEEKGTIVSIGSGEHLCFVEAGITLEESRKNLEDKMDDVIYNKPVAFVKKLKRRLNK